MTTEIKKTARTRATGTKSAKAQLEEASNEVHVEPTVEEKPVEVTTPVEKTPRVIQDTDKILVLNNCKGTYGYDSPNGYSFDLVGYGTTTTVPMEILRKMASGKHRSHLTRPWLIILDEDVVEELNLTRQYEQFYTPEEVDKLLANPQILRENFDAMTKAMQKVILSQVRQRIQAKEFNDYSVIAWLRDDIGLDITV